MPKQVLQVTNFAGGLNAYSDARDIEDNQFVQNWNAVVDKNGIIRVSGMAEDSIATEYFDNTNFQKGHGLFQFTADYSLSGIDGDFKTGIKTGTIARYDVLDSTEVLNNTGNFSSNWTASGDFAIDATDASYTHSSGSGSIYQTSFSHAPTASKTHLLVYTISGTITSPNTTLTLKGGSGYLASEDIVLSGTSDATHTIAFKTYSNLSGVKFQIDVSSTTAEAFNIDDISVKQITGVELESTAAEQSENYFQDWIIYIYSGSGKGQSRKIIYSVATTPPSLTFSANWTTALGTDSKYIIYRWTPSADFKGDGTNNYDYIEDDGNGDYSLLSKTGAISTNTSNALGYVDFEPKLSLVPGDEYTVSFNCRASQRYYNAVSNGHEDGNTTNNYADKVPWIELYSTTVADRKGSIKTF